MVNFNIFSAKPLPVIYIHIGMNKTGTTALQNYFQQGQSALARAGVLYPTTGRIGTAHYALSASLGFCNPSVSPSWKQDIRCLKRDFLREVSGSTKKVVFSSEDFLLNKPFEHLKSFFDGYPLKVVVYLRRHDHWWLSAYAQAVKMKHLPPWNLGPQGFINYNRRHNKHYGDYRHLVDRWAGVIGKDNVIVRPYEDIQNKPDLAADFLQAIESREVIAKVPRMQARDNASLPLPSVQLMDIFQRIDTEPKIREKLLAHAHCYKNVDNSSLRDMVNPQFLLNLMNSYQDDYSYIAREYLGRNDGRLFYEALPEPDPDWKAPRWPSQAEVAQEVLKVVAAGN